MLTQMTPSRVAAARRVWSSAWRWNGGKLDNGPREAFISLLLADASCWPQEIVFSMGSGRRTAPLFIFV